MQDDGYRAPMHNPDHGEVLKVMREIFEAFDAKPGLEFEHPGNEQVAALYVSLRLYGKHLLKHFEALLQVNAERISAEMETVRNLRAEASKDEEALGRYLWQLGDQLWALQHPGEPVPEHPADPTPF